ncbi:MAG TPA: HAMP domain-containing sensor histidine kinase [Bacteroidia bacterium]|nr:HAMP domain-containing sensor histidine kinase [Bacteroidia bacterium]
MKLQVKLALYNAISKALIIGAFGAIIPVIIQGIVYDHIDKRLSARLEKMMRMVQIGGLNEISLDQDCSFDSYNVFKEEYVSISPLSGLPGDFGKRTIENTERLIENDIVKHRVLSQAFLYDNQLYEIEIGEGLSTIDQLNDTIRQFTIRILLAVILLSIFIDLGFARILLLPFNRIVNKKLKDVQHPSTFDATPVKTSTYEFAHLDRSINEMMHKIKETFQIEREFITNVSHELLTPISILQNRIENIINEPGISNEILNRLVDSQKTLSRLTRIVKALLYISKIENDQYLKSEEVSLQNLCTEVLEEMAERIEEKSIRISSEFDSDFIYGPCNRSLIHTLVLNIVSNAIKYTKMNGEIKITGRSADTNFHLTISDTGVGIPSEHLPFIFDRFKRFHPEDGMSYGLGLPIVKSIATFHKLELKVDSQPDKGTNFHLFFPIQGN